ncbi:hypothetical protein E2562_024428 [Oryza meyeriana var. granulata]|uniref:DUF834 domain-containing protein n=1 Tax=Oryza meyeriana var. granulata TaxID=110450 RepID=A0A6G1EYM9_9ORYZ|nr:hypothetical protein E2562_024428 [Oryza meyeriana var. granulata]
MAKKAFPRRLGTKGRRQTISKRAQRRRGDRRRPAAPETTATTDWSRRMRWRPQVHEGRQSPAGFGRRKMAAGVEGDAVKPMEEVAWLGSD